MEYSFWDASIRHVPLGAPWGRWGFGIGPPDDLMPARRSEPRGYLRVAEHRRANDDLLAHFRGRGTARRSSPRLDQGKRGDSIRRRAARAPWVNSLGTVRLPTQGSRITITAVHCGTDHEKTIRIGAVLSRFAPRWNGGVVDQTRTNCARSRSCVVGYVQPGVLRQPSRGARYTCANYADLMRISAVLTDICCEPRSLGRSARGRLTYEAIAATTRIFVGNTMSCETSSPKRHREINELMKLTFDQRGDTTCSTWDVARAGVGGRATPRRSGAFFFSGPSRDGDWSAQPRISHPRSQSFGSGAKKQTSRGQELLRDRLDASEATPFRTPGIALRRRSRR